MLPVRYMGSAHYGAYWWSRAMATLVANGHSKKETVVLGEIAQAWWDIQMTAWLNTVRVGGSRKKSLSLRLPTVKPCTAHFQIQI